MSTDPSNPDHYTTGGIECIDYLRAKMTSEEFRGYCKGNALKYLSRLGHKHPTPEGKLNDISKAAVYLDWLAEDIRADINQETEE